MKKIFFDLFLLFCVFPLFALTDLELGSKVPENAVIVEDTLILAAPSQFQKMYKWSDHEANYLLGVDAEGYVQYICVDSLFIRAEGLIPRPSGAKQGVLNPTAIPYENTIPRCSATGLVIKTDEQISIGDKYSEIKKIPSIKIAYWFEWGYCVELPSGWILQFKNNEYYDFYRDGFESFRFENKKISDNATVIQIFKGTLGGYGLKKSPTPPLE